MLPSLRHVCARTSRTSIRSLATSSSSDTVNDVLATVGNVINENAEIVTETKHSSPPATQTVPTSTSTSPSIFNIPPEEDPLLRLLTNMIQTNGNRQKAARITSRTLLHLHAFTRAPPLPILRQAIHAAAPAVKCSTTRLGPKTLIRPNALGEKQRVHIAIDWILKASSTKSGQTLEERLAREMIAVIKGDSEALKKKELMHKEAFANRSMVGRAV